jgi:hypothetical protein
MGAVNNFGNGGLSNAFNQPQYPQYQAQYQQPQYQQTQQVSGGPNPGQPYQIPTQYANYPAGSVVNWGRYRYQLGSDGTMTSYTGPDQAGPTTNTQQTSGGPAPGKRYQIPAEHAGTAPGTQINYAGYNYVANDDGTMTAFNTPGQDDANGQQADTGPVPGKRYQIPAEHASAKPGSLITYGENKYVANDDGTMTAFTSPQ